TLGLKTRTTAILAAEKRKISPLMDERSIQKIFKIDEHIGASYAGMAGDGRILLDYAIQRALLHRFYYDEPIPVEYLAKLVCDVKQLYTQHAGVRPFGVSIIFAGVDERGSQVYMTEPSGRYIGYYATAIGEKSNTISEFLEKNYKYDLDVKDSIKLSVEAVIGIIENKPYENYIELGYTDIYTKQFRVLMPEEIREYIKELEREGKIKT
ncbi:MAG: archaeal proteasome endopeptidase complex subunit alpha, partial [Desulfurococcaceae archaeon]